jgi:hypothetical protein
MQWSRDACIVAGVSSRLTCVRMQWVQWTNCALCPLLAVSCGDAGLALFTLTVSSPRMDYSTFVATAGSACTREPCITLGKLCLLTNSSRCDRSAGGLAALKFQTCLRFAIRALQVRKPPHYATFSILLLRHPFWRSDILFDSFLVCLKIIPLWCDAM